MISFLIRAGGLSRSNFYKLPAFSRTSAAFSAGVFALRACAGYARGSRVFKQRGAACLHRASICHAISRISHCARLQQRSEKKVHQLPRVHRHHQPRCGGVGQHEARTSSLALSFAAPPSFFLPVAIPCLHGLHLADEIPAASSPSASMAGESRNQRPSGHGDITLALHGETTRACAVSAAPEARLTPSTAKVKFACSGHGKVAALHHALHKAALAALTFCCKASKSALA